MRKALLSYLCLAGLAACAPDTPRAAVPAGPALKDPITIEFALFYPEPPREEPQAALDALLAHDRGLTRVDKLPEKDFTRRVVSAWWVSDARESYPAPDPEALRSFGRGLDSAQAEALQGTDNVLVLDFGHGKEHVWSGMRDALRLTSALARRTGGLIWDEETREMFTPDFWDETRISTWTGTEGPPDLRNHFTIHAYRKDSGYRRVISLGLAKFGLPDLVAENMSGSSTNSMMGTINVLAQTLAEGAEIGRGGEIDVDIHALRNASIREAELRSQFEKAAGKARLRLVQGNPEDGDPHNRLAEIVFDRYPGPDPQARQERMLTELFGSREAGMANVNHDAPVLEASRRAREKLLALKPAFQAGLPPGEVLLVKSPFLTPDGGREWMWVEVIEWKGGKILGSLRNEPALVKALKAGQTVEVREADVFDYSHTLADGSSEGNETEKYLHPEG